MSEKALILYDNTKRDISFLPAAHELKQLALEKSSIVGKVETADENQVAFEAQSELAEIRKQVEKARVIAKQPSLDEGRRIDAAAKAFLEEIGPEEMRVAKLIGDFQQLELAKQRAAEKAKKLEEERIERERQAELRRIAEKQAAEQRAREQEARRIADEAAAIRRRQDAESAEAARLASEATNAKQRAEAERQRKELEARQAREREEAERARIELERANALAAAKSHEAFEAANQKANDAQAAIAQTPSAAPVRAAGQKVKTDVEITVTNIWLLAKAHPTCVKIEPVISEIKSLLAAGVNVAGVTSKEVVKSQTVGRAMQQAIDV